MSQRAKWTAHGGTPRYFVIQEDMRDKTYQLGDVKSRVRYIQKNEALECGGRDCYFIFDEHTVTLFEKNAMDSLQNRRLVLPAGENEKRLSSVEKILERFVSAGLSRESTILAVGGGVVCDMAAFAASVYMRGCGIILVPTSLLAMVDASVGGKTGVDFSGYKNMVGTFYPAEEIRICTEFLESLPEDEFLNGLAEVIKHALLGSEHLLSLLTERRESVFQRDAALMSEIVGCSLDVKGQIVENDFREQGQRAFLNFGHTFGHALETAGGFQSWSHGQAVVWGIRVALTAGITLGVTDPGYAAMVNQLFDLYGYQQSAKADVSVVMEALQHDKKKKGGTVRFVLQRDFGDTFQTELDAAVIESSIKKHLR